MWLIHNVFCLMCWCPTSTWSYCYHSLCMPNKLQWSERRETWLYHMHCIQYLILNMVQAGIKTTYCFYFKLSVPEFHQPFSQCVISPFQTWTPCPNPIASKRAGLFYESAPWSLLQIAHGAKWQNLPDSYVYILVSMLALCTSFLHFKFFRSQRNIRLLWTIPKVLSWGQKRNICDAVFFSLYLHTTLSCRYLCTRQTSVTLFIIQNILSLTETGSIRICQQMHCTSDVSF